MHMWFDAQLDQKNLDGLYDISQRLSKKIRKKILQTTDTKNTQNKKKKNYEHLLDSEQVIECNFSLL